MFFVTPGTRFQCDRHILQHGLTCSQYFQKPCQRELFFNSLKSYCYSIERCGFGGLARQLCLLVDEIVETSQRSWTGFWRLLGIDSRGEGG